MRNLSGFHRAAVILLSAAAVASLCRAVETHVWQQDEVDEFNRGTVKNLAIRSDGHVTLSPAFRELADPGVPYLWSMVQDAQGTIYCAGGAPTGSTAKIIAISRDGKSRTLGTLNALEIHALALDKKGRLYAATSPDSKIYRIEANGKTDLFFDPHAKYVWALAFDNADNLYVATGDQGVVYRVSPDGHGAEFLRTEESHARSMIIDSKGDLIIGTEPGGTVLRVHPNGKSFVLFQTGKREVTAVAEHDGYIYAAAAAGKAPVLALPVAPTTPAAGTGTAAATAPNRPVTPPQTAAVPQTAGALAAALAAAATAGGSDFYRIGPDGSAEKIWNSTTSLIYAIGFDANGRPLLGTGNKGIVFRVDSDVLFTQLINAPPTQVTSFLQGRDGTLYAATGNVGKVYAVGPGFEKTGSIESDVLDAGGFAYWGKVHVLGDSRDGKIAITTRTGNVNRPQKNWSDWSDVPLKQGSAATSSPAARFIQYRLTLSAGPANTSPDVTAVQVAYLPKNIAPRVEQIEVTPANYKTSPTATLERTTIPSGSPSTLSLPALGQRRPPKSPLSVEGASGITLQYAKGYITVRWNASDENDDPLQFKVEIREKNGPVWRPLKPKLSEKYYSFDGSAFPDGEYTIRVTASDAPGNMPSEALEATLESEPFTIDNTPPQILSSGVTTVASQQVIHISAKDNLNWIDKAEYSVNGAEWIPLEPVNRVSDSESLDYDLKLPTPSTPEIVAVRLFDDADNVTVTRFAIGR